MSKHSPLPITAEKTKDGHFRFQDNDNHVILWTHKDGHEINSETERANVNYLLEATNNYPKAKTVLSILWQKIIDGEIGEIKPDDLMAEIEQTIIDIGIDPGFDPET